MSLEYERMLINSFLAVESTPSFPIEFKIEFGDELSINKIDKSITHITRIVWIHRKIEKVVFITMILINFVDQHLLRVLVRNMPYHYCRAAIILDLHVNKILPCRYLFWISHFHLLLVSIFFVFVTSTVP